MHRLTSTWDRMFGKLRSKRTSKKRKGLTSHKRRSFAIEPLEERTLLSVNPLGDETLLNSYTAGTQRLYDSGDAVAAMPDGGYVTTWTSENQDGDGKGVFAQRLDAAGAAIGSEFLVNTTTDRSQQRSSVAVDADGGFVVVWDSYGQDGILAGVFGQRYNAEGQAVGGEFQVNETSFGHQSSPAVACLDDGGFVVVWSGPGNGDLWGVFGRRYDADGQATGGEFLINSDIGNLQRLPAVAALPNSGFVVAWQSHGGQDGRGTGVFAQRFDADCDPVGDEFLVNTTTSGHQNYPAVATDADGRFTIAWQGNGQDSRGRGIFAQRFDADGTAVGGEFQVNTYASNNQKYPSVAYNDHGGFVVAWNGRGAGDPNGVFVREFGADGVALGNESLVNTTTNQSQRFASVTAASSGYVVVWSGKGTGDNNGVFMQRLGSAPTTSGIADKNVYVGCAHSTVELWPAFEDEESADVNLNYEVTGNTTPQLFSSIEIDPTTGQLTLAFVTGVPGVSQLTVRATDPGGLFIETSFSAEVVCPGGDPPLYWYPDQNHIWSTTDANWNDQDDGQGNTYVWNNNGYYSAVFLNEADTVAVDGSIIAHSVKFEVSGYLVEAEGEGTDELELDGTGEGANTITVASGVTGSEIAVDIVLDESIDVDVVDTTLEISGVISGSYDLTKTGAGTLTLTGENEYTDGTTISAGTLKLSGGDNRLSTSGAITIAGGTLDLDGNTQSTSGLLSFTDTDGGMVQNGTLTFTGVGAVIQANKSGTISADIFVTNTQQWNVNSSETLLCIEGDVTSGNSITVQGDGTAEFGNAYETYDYDISVLQARNGATVTFTTGNLNAYNVAAAFNGSVNWYSTGELSCSNLYISNSGSDAFTHTNGIVDIDRLWSWASADTYNLDGGTLQLSHLHLYGLVDFGGGTLKAKSDLTVSASMLYAIAGGKTATIDTNGYDVTLAGVISGDGSLIKTGEGTLILTGENTYSGDTTIEAGVLVAGDPELAPYVLAGGDASADEGEQYTLQLSTSVSVSNWQINWGDGGEDSVPGAQTSATHVYADGPNDHSIVATATDSQDHSAMVMLPPVAVTNVAPTLTLGGDSAVNEGTTYTLTLYPVVDPGQDTVQKYVIDWGDGQQSTYTAAEIADLNRQVTHAYAHGPSSPTILVNLIDEDGRYVGVSNKAVTVEDAAPSFAPGSTSQVGYVGYHDNGDPITFPIVVADPADALTYELSGLPEEMADSTIDANGIFHWTPAASDAGETYTFDVTVTNQSELSATETFTLAVQSFFTSAGEIAFSTVRPDAVRAAWPNCTEGQFQISLTGETPTSSQLVLGSGGIQDGWLMISSEGYLSWSPSIDCREETYHITVTYTHPGDQPVTKDITLNLANEDLRPAFFIDRPDPVYDDIHEQHWHGHDANYYNYYPTLYIPQYPGVYERQLQLPRAYDREGAVTYELIADLEKYEHLPQDAEIDANGLLTCKFTSPDDAYQVYQFDVKATDSTGKVDIRHVVLGVHVFYQGWGTTQIATNTYAAVEENSGVNRISVMGIGSSLMSYYNGVLYIDAQPAHGTLQLDPDYLGCVLYTPDQDYHGLDTFAYHWRYEKLDYWHPYTLPPLGWAETNCSRQQIQVGNWVDLEPDEQLGEYSTVLAVGGKTTATLTLQNPRADGVSTPGFWELCFNHDLIRVYDTAGKEILPPPSMSCGWSGDTFLETVADEKEITLTVVGVSAGDANLLASWNAWGGEHDSTLYPDVALFDGWHWVTNESIDFDVVDVDLDIDSDNANGLERSDHEDKIEDKTGAEYPGKIIAVNDEDVDGDGIPDFADGFGLFGADSNSNVGEEFVPLALELLQPIDYLEARLRITYDDSDPNDVTRTPQEPYVYTPAEGHLRIWNTWVTWARDPNSVKAETPGDYVPSDTYDDLTQLGFDAETRVVTLYVEGIDASESVADQRIIVEVDPDGATGPLDFIAVDAVRCTVVSANLTSYRPLHAGGNYAPFARTEVSEVDEEKADLGPGIRINGDDDNENQTADRFESHAVAGENDLIEVVIQRDPTDMNFRLRRSNDSIMVWTTRDKGTSIAFDNDNYLETNDLTFAPGAQEMTVWVEWVGFDHGTADLSIRESTSGLALDKVKFHTFHSIVIVLGGETQEPGDPVPPENQGNYGIFEQIAVPEYRNGYDVWMFNEDDVDWFDGEGDVYDEIVRAIQGRGVTQVAIMGYSHGGGATYQLAERLHRNTVPDDLTDITNPFTVPYTAYIDAVTSYTASPENRRPLLSAFHCNQYQTNLPLRGGPANGDDDIDRTYLGVVHGTIDDNATVIELVRLRFSQRVTTR